MAGQRKVAKRAWPELPSHRPNVLSNLLGIRHQHHDALSDARAAGTVIVRAMEHTSIEVAGWLSLTGSSGNPAPKPAAVDPLRGERIAILGAPRDGLLGQFLAAQGALVVASVGKTTTMLVVISEQPFGTYFTAHTDDRRADEMRAISP